MPRMCATSVRRATTCSCSTRCGAPWRAAGRPASASSSTATARISATTSAIRASSPGFARRRRAIAAKHRDKLLNAYDNSVLYTDHFLARTIEYLRGMSDTRSALLYCADHGEDLIDDERERPCTPPHHHPRPGSSMWRAGVVFGCLPPRIPGKAGGGAAQRRGARDHPRDVPHTDGRHRPR